jgi:hypothetical protein
MGEYLRNTLYTRVKLWESPQVIQDCTVVYETSQPRLVKFKFGWSSFARLNNYKVGDKIRFLMTNLHIGQYIVVSRV